MTKNSIYITDTKSVRVREDGSDLVLDIGDNPGNFGRITVENGAESDLIDKIEISSGSDTTHYGLLGDDTFERNTITNDTYMFRKGDGIDTIHDYLNGDKAVPRLENAGLDELVIEGYSKEQAVFNKDGNDLEVSFLDENNNIQQDRIVIKQYFNSDFLGNNGTIETITFTNDIQSSSKETIVIDDYLVLLNGTEGEYLGNNKDQYIIGSTGSDTIKANGGEDILDGKGGSDTYIFENGFGKDTIRFDIETPNSLDTVLFKNIDSKPVLKRESGSSDLIVWFSDANHLTIESFFDNEVARIGTFEFENRFGKTEYSSSQILDSFSLSHGVRPFETEIELDGIDQGLRILDSNVSNYNLIGTSDNDEIYGFGGTDDINGGDGADIIVGGTGNDKLNGGTSGKGIDELYGESGEDTYYLDKGFGSAKIFENGTSSFEVNTVRISGFNESDATYDSIGGRSNYKSGFR